jgi:hypothetical protein
MSRLAPSHPLSRYAPEAFRDKIDVLGVHLIWTGTLSGRRTNGGLTRHPLFKEGRDSSHNASRLAWQWIVGETLVEEDILFKKSSCIHERCVAPGCFEKGSYKDIPDNTNFSETHRRVS